MPIYSFEALSADGQPRKGLLEADSARVARSQLRAQLLVPLKVELAGPKPPRAMARTPWAANWGDAASSMRWV
jgi:general secretion pathway protein F